MRRYYILGLLLICMSSLATNAEVKRQYNQPSIAKRHICKYAAWGFCFESKISLVDSVNHYGGPLSDTVYQGYSILVYKFSKTEETSLRKQCMISGFTSLPFISIDSFPPIAKYYNNSQKGYYKETSARGGLFTRFQIINFSQRKMVVFQVGV